MNDFSAKTIKALSRKGVSILGPVAIPDMSSAMPWANASRGWSVNDNGCGRVWTLSQVLAAAK
jgi:hypothetical protein